MAIEQELSLLGGELPSGISEGVALGTGLADGYHTYLSPVGEVAVTFNTEGVSSLDVADSDFESRFVRRHRRGLVPAEPPAAWGRHIPEAIEAGRPGRLPVDFRSVTPFRAEVLRGATAIPRGEVRSYGWLARAVSRPGAARAVGSTMANNPLPLIIPCHRVVRSDGMIGEYSLGGPENKWRLLRHEGVAPERLVALAERGIRVQGNRSTHIYCHPTCRSIRGSHPEHVVDFRSSDEARAAGFRACGSCRPG